MFPEAAAPKEVLALDVVSTVQDEPLPTIKPPSVLDRPARVVKSKSYA